MTANGDTLSSITDETETLVSEMDYSVNGNSVTIRKAYLVGESTSRLTLNFSTGTSQTVYIAYCAGGGGGFGGTLTYYNVTGGEIKCIVGSKAVCLPM